MPESNIKTAFLGLSPNGQKLLSLIEGMEQYSVCAVSDKDIDVASKFASRFEGCNSYDDYRQMIMQNEVDLVIIAEPIFDSIEHIRSGIKKKSNIFKLSPCGRDFSEASELAGLAKNEKVCFCLGNYWRNSGSWSNLKDYILQGRIENPSLIEIKWNVPSQIHHEKSWMRDPKMAGGGVLLYEGYEAIDLVVSNFGLPDQVYALNITNAPDKQQRAYLTEDTAVLMMRFSESLTANLIISRTFGPEHKSVKIYGQNHNIEVSDNVFKTFDNEEISGGGFEYFDERDNLIKKTLDDLAKHLLGEIDKQKICTINDNLPIMSVIEACYVSAKTLMPEEPGKILNLSQPESGKNWLK